MSSERKIVSREILIKVKISVEEMAPSTSSDTSKSSDVWGDEVEEFLQEADYTRQP